MKKTFSEKDMYQPIKTFFSSIGYVVNGEVKHCDITLVKEDRLIVVEMKKSLNLTLIFQAMDRQKIADEVYIAIPRFKKSRGANYSQVSNLVKKLGIGLITVAMDSPIKTVEIIVFPELSNVKMNINKKNSVLKEASARTFDLNKGGSTKTKLMTAFRERAIKIACALESCGEQKASVLMKEYDCPKDCYQIMYRNDYGWFERCGNGFFRITNTCKKELEDQNFKQVVEYYRTGVHINGAN